MEQVIDRTVPLAPAMVPAIDRIVPLAPAMEQVIDLVTGPKIVPATGLTVRVASAVVVPIGKTTIGVATNGLVVIG